MKGCAFQVEGSSRLIGIDAENHQYEYSSFQIPLLATVSYFKTSICYTLSVLIFKLGIGRADAAHLLNTQKTAAPRIEKASSRLFLTLDLVCSLASVNSNTSYRILIQVNATCLVKGENPSRSDERSCQGLQI